MGLPIQKAPKFKCQLSDGKEVEFRPFLVKEQKYLLIAKESISGTEVLSAIKALITGVTEGKVDADKLPIFDLEYLFLQIRSKSIGESVTIDVYCKELECSGTGSTTVDLNEVGIVYPEDKVDATVELSETLGVTLRYPTTKQLAESEDIEDRGDKLIALLSYGIETVFDNETVYTVDEIENSELIEFVESLNLDQVEKLQKFFDSAPSLQEEVEYKCDSCGTLNTTTLKGLQSFF